MEYNIPIKLNNVNPLNFGAIGDNIIDDTDSIISTINYANSKNKSIKFPRSKIFYITNTITIPSDMIIDFNNSTIEAINDIDYPPIVISGDNVKLKNLKLTEKNHNYGSDVSGIELDDKNIKNLHLDNIVVNGFVYGINLQASNGYLLTNCNIKHCITDYGSAGGINISNATNVELYNHTAMYNKYDGLKTIKNCQYLKVFGGNFSYNEDPVGTYADGIDLYAGIKDCVISNAICNNNGGVGIHILSGELNDINYQDPVYSIIKNIILDNCICKNNKTSGIDCIIKSSVSPTVPYPSKIIINSCIVEENEQYGFNITARNIQLNNCIAIKNYKQGYHIINSWGITLNNCDALINSYDNVGLYPGIRVYGSKFVKISGGNINGCDDDTLQNEDDSSLTTYHSFGIRVEDTVNCDNIDIINPRIRNYTGSSQVDVSDNASYPDVKIRVVLGEINDTVSNYNGYIGSSLFKNGIKYIKYTKLDSSTWTISHELDGVITWNPSSLTPDGSELSSDITVTGANLGDFVLVSAPYNLQGIIATAYVSASDTVKILIYNESVSVVDLAEGDWKVKVIK